MLATGDHLGFWKWNLKAMRIEIAITNWKLFREFSARQRHLVSTFPKRKLSFFYYFTVKASAAAQKLFRHYSGALRRKLITSVACHIALEPVTRSFISHSCPFNKINFFDFADEKKKNLMSDGKEIYNPFTKAIAATAAGGIMLRGDKHESLRAPSFSFWKARHLMLSLWLMPPWVYQVPLWDYLRATHLRRN